jgi:hypothetical protein
MAVDGTYQVEIDTPMGRQSGKLTLKTAGGSLTGTADTMLGKNDFTGTVKGDEAFWKVEIKSPMGAMKLEFKSRVAGDSITGEVKAGSFGSFPFQGKKI